jgi:hypothetical protein
MCMCTKSERERRTVTKGAMQIAASAALTNCLPIYTHMHTHTHLCPSCGGALAAKMQMSKYPICDDWSVGVLIGNLQAAFRLPNRTI